MKKKTNYFLAIFLVFYSYTVYTQRLVEVGHGWAKTTVNVPVFRKNSVVSHHGIQYAAYYDSVGRVVVAKRQLSSKEWEISTTQYTGNVKDAHNSISIMVDGDGYLHMAWDHHNHPLRYCRSVEPGSLKMSDKIAMTSEDESNVTYPEFFKLPEGDLIFMFRSGASGHGNLVMKRYKVKEKKWMDVQRILIDGEGQRNAYWQAFIDSKGIIHLSWVWRETWDVATNHDLCYARSSDGGVTWEKSNGHKYVLPINAENAEYACRIPQKSELINQTSMYADNNGRPYIATYWRQGSVVQYHLVYHDGNQWNTQVITERTTSFSLSGGGTKKIPISRPQIMVNNKGKRITAHLIFRDMERGDRVSIATCNDLQKKRWTYKDLTDFPVGNWEPSYDTELWKSTSKLHLFVQYAGQGDGEKIQDVAPQMVYIIEAKLK